MCYRRTLLVLAALTFAVAQAAAQAPSSGGISASGNSDKITSKATTPGSSAPTIKSDSAINAVNAHIPAPSGKGGPTTRGSGSEVCSVHVDNQTPWLISVYVDIEKSGYELTGEVGRYGDLLGATGNGSTSFYARATFNDGSTKEWGPAFHNCPAHGTFTWTLTR